MVGNANGWVFTRRTATTRPAIYCPSEYAPNRSTARGAGMASNRRDPIAIGAWELFEDWDLGFPGLQSLLVRFSDTDYELRVTDYQ
jgi:hypothetical protein